MWSMKIKLLYPLRHLSNPLSFLSDIPGHVSIRLCPREGIPGLGCLLLGSLDLLLDVRDLLECFLSLLLAVFDLLVKF
jgi:hypothetical protein